MSSCLRMTSFENFAGDMSRRLYHPKHERLYQCTKGGNFYIRQGDTEICLETSDVERALANMAMQDALNERFGAAAFKFKTGMLFPKFLGEKKKTIRPSTFELYESIWANHFEKTFGKVAIGNIDQPAWLKFCAKTKSISDFQNSRNLMHNFLVWCEMRRFILAIPTLKNPAHKRRRRRVIPPQHLVLIFQRGQNSLLLFTSLALFMGMRRKEIMTLSWDRVDLEARTILLRDEDVKTDDGRQIPITDVVHALLLKRMAEQQASKIKTDWVFPNAMTSRRHADLRGLMGSWRRCLLDCGLAEKAPTKSKSKRRKFKIVVEYTWHDLRATYEKHSHMSRDYSDTQKEKMVGAEIDVQKRLYVSMDANDLRGLEEVVSKQVPELVQVITRKTGARKVETGNGLEKENLKLSGKAVTIE